MTLNLFYEDKDDRWFPGDRHLRRMLRRMLLGEPRMSGQLRVFLNLCAGLDRLGIRYRVNDYRYIAQHPDELACIIGRPFLLDKFAWKNPILLGVASYNHPLDDPDLFKRLPVKKVVVPGEWYADMYRSYWPDTEAWPVGIDTDLWAPSHAQDKTIDVLLYDKVHWDRERHVTELIEPVRARLLKEGRSFTELRYGSYKEEDFQAALARSRSMIFLCQNESQGIAYQQALSCGVPVFAWDPGGPWRDPDYFPHRVRFEPVSSVPYWDERCGLKFVDRAGFDERWPDFWGGCTAEAFDPRGYVLDNLTLEQRALQYYEIARSIVQQEAPRAPGLLVDGWLTGIG
ncbi:glycosyltransferase [Bradyrhizobium centrolobii]|uniref:Glycosyltransferase n=1 Tax=Bradyrhizobium centrolobii TaxID=1505087 RepID=A0A176YHJ8_9BRAD|nr:glycosyltransferase [Bradyrhizobium centrolobii]OAF05318.1 glycosyltransferase [Bradyrhizobium centrolobii]